MYNDVNPHQSDSVSSSPTRAIRYVPALLLGAGTIAGLYLAGLRDYLFFHILVEGFSIVVACGVFMLAWNSRRILDNGYLLFLGVAYLCIGVMDFSHTLAFKGMGVFSGFQEDLATQLWIAARYLQAASFLLAPLALRIHFKPRMLLGGYVLVTALLLTVIFAGGFPDCGPFTDGRGLTGFKIGSEYGVCAILLVAAGLLYRRRAEFERSVLRLLLASMFLTIASELSFTLYVDPYGFFNLLGHFLKLASFYLIYKAVIVTGLTRPYDLLYRRLRDSDARFRSLFRNMTEGFALHEIITDEQGNPRDYRFLEVNPGFERLTGLRREDILGRCVREVLPGTEDHWIETFGRVALQGTSARIKNYSAELGRWYEVIAYCPAPRQCAVIFTDITDRKQAEDELKASRAAALNLMEDAVAARHQAEETAAALAVSEEELRKSRDELEDRVAARTGELRDMVNELQKEIARRKIAERTARDNLEKIEEKNKELSFLAEQLRVEVKDRVRAEERIQKERDHLYSVLNMFPGYVVIKDQRYRIHFTNHGFLDVFNEPKDQTCHKVQYNLDAPCSHCPMTAVLKEQKEYDWEDSYPNGRSYHIWMFPFRDTDGSLLCLEFGVDITEQKKLERLVSETSDEERRNIGRDLHDTLGQNLTGLGYLIRALVDRLEIQQPEDHELAKKIVDTVKQATAQVRALAHGLDPVGLEADGLLAGLREFTSSFETSYGVPCTLQCDDLPMELDSFATTQLYRIVQEAANNAAKYAQADHINISLSEDGQAVRLRIIDDGIGLPEDANDSSGMGLRVMRYRAGAIGATLNIRTQKGKGTSIECLLPKKPFNWKAVL